VVLATAGEARDDVPRDLHGALETEGLQTMHIVHGTWVPDEPGSFVQRGYFYLWVETDAPTTGRRLHQGDATHPRHLMQAALATFLEDKLGFRDPPARLLSSVMEIKYLFLPSVDGMPLPCFELLPYLDQEVPAHNELAPWQVCCYRVPHLLTALSDIHFIAQQKSAEDFQLGSDLVFWWQYTQALKAIFAKDQYIPALKYQMLSTDGQTRPKSPSAIKLYPTWEMISEAHETTLQRYAACMPHVCAAGSHTPGPVVLFASTPLLRHFSECLLQDLVVATPFPANFEQKVAGSLLYRCIHPSSAPYASLHSPPPGDTLEEYQQWLVWREQLISAHTDAGFALCFRLEEAPPGDADGWRIQLLVASKRDPSLKMPLREYWRLAPKAHDEARRRFGPDFDRKLLLALGTAARIYPKVWNGLRTAEPDGFPLSLEEAHAFLTESAWVLEDAGYVVIVPSWWTPEGRRRMKVRLKTALRPAKGSSPRSRGYFNLETVIAYKYHLSIGGEAITEAEWQELVNAKTPLVQFRGQWIELDRDKMGQMLAFWQAQEEQASDEMTLRDLLQVAAEAGEEVEWDHDPLVQDMLSKLHDKSAFAPIEDPPGLCGALRDYQRRGVAWLQYLERLGLGACLADEMGLGKTIQVIARLLTERDEAAGRPPTLLIAPTSVLGNWRREIERFAPALRTLLHHGSARIRDERAFAVACRTCDVVLTSFTLARLDSTLLRSIQWHRIVVDEAQNIKNPASVQTRAITKLAATHRLALTGTPVENRLRDLWSIFNYFSPGYLGKETQFRKAFEAPIQKENDPVQAAALKRLIEPFILRRVKTDKRIIDDLPDKIEQRVFCTLTPEQASLYEAVVKDVAEQLDAAAGIQRKGLILATLLRLKQICNHPAHFLQDGSAFSAERSHKLQRLSEMVEEVIASGESLLIFTQFTEVGAALDRYMAHALHCHTYYLHGGTNAAKRDRMIREFQDSTTAPSVFVLSLRAGGVGLTLTKANHVFHFDRWWNPAVEDQASDRAFRIGQRKNVFVHKFVTMGTLEDRIDAMIEEKKRLSSAIVAADESWLTELDNETFKQLIALQHSAILE
jgi:SNF2 family DNA or RNA helicase